MRKLGTLVPVIGVVVMLAGCGSSSSSNSQLSYSAFSNAADTICKTATANGGSSLNGVSPTANATTGKAISSAVTAVEAAVPKLQALSGPSSLESVRDSFVSNTNKTITILKSAASAANSGDQTAFVAALQQAAPLVQTTNSEGSQLGAPNCAK